MNWAHGCKKSAVDAGDCIAGIVGAEFQPFVDPERPRNIPTAYVRQICRGNEHDLITNVAAILGIDTQFGERALPIELVGPIGFRRLDIWNESTEIQRTFAHAFASNDFIHARGAD